jgi:hypothetical protein
LAIKCDVGVSSQVNSLINSTLDKFGEVATTMQQGLDSRYYLLNKNKMLSPQEVAEKIVEMILDDKNYQNGESVDIDK